MRNNTLRTALKYYMSLFELKNVCMESERVQIFEIAIATIRL